MEFNLEKYLQDPYTQFGMGVLGNNRKGFGNALIGGFNTMNAAKEANTKRDYNKRQQDLLETHYGNETMRAQNDRRKLEQQQRSTKAEAKMFLPGFMKTAGIQGGFDIDDDGNLVPIEAPNVLPVSGNTDWMQDTDNDYKSMISASMQSDDPQVRRQAVNEMYRYYRDSKKNSQQAKDMIAKERAIAEALNIPVGDYLQQKLLGNRGQSININNIMPDSKSVTPDQTEKLVKRGLLGDQIGRLQSNFKDDYAGYKLDSVGDASNWLKARFGNDSSQVNWWKDYKDYENQVRHELFGAALTGYEIDQWQQANVSPGMKPDVVRENLRRRNDIEKEWLERTNKALGSSGYVRESVGTATGKNPSKSTPNTATKGKLTPAEQKELDELRRRFPK